MGCIHQGMQFHILCRSSELKLSSHQWKNSTKWERFLFGSGISFFPKSFWRGSVILLLFSFSWKFLSFFFEAVNLYSYMFLIKHSLKASWTKPTVVFDTIRPQSPPSFSHQVFKPTPLWLRQPFCHISSCLLCLVEPVHQLTYQSCLYHLPTLCLLAPMHSQTIHPKKLEQTPLHVPESALSQDVHVLPSPPRSCELYGNTSFTIFYWCCLAYYAQKTAFEGIFSAMTQLECSVLRWGSS